jgi:hypothetical protein
MALATPDLAKGGRLATPGHEVADEPSNSSGEAGEVLERLASHLAVLGWLVGHL